jgi:hypothetical protein
MTIRRMALFGVAAMAAVLFALELPSRISTSTSTASSTTSTPCTRAWRASS